MTREEAINLLGCIYTEVSTEEDREAIDKAIEALKEPKHGEWVLDKEFSFVLNIYECSKCRFNGSKRWHFCPNCGSDNRPRILDEAVDGEGKDGNVKEGEAE